MLPNHVPAQHMDVLNFHRRLKSAGREAVVAVGDDAEASGVRGDTDGLDTGDGALSTSAPSPSVLPAEVMAEPWTASVSRPPGSSHRKRSATESGGRPPMAPLPAAGMGGRIRNCEEEDFLLSTAHHPATHHMNRGATLWVEEDRKGGKMAGARPFSRSSLPKLDGTVVLRATARGTPVSHSSQESCEDSCASPLPPKESLRTASMYLEEPGASTADGGGSDSLTTPREDEDSLWSNVEEEMQNSDSKDPAYAETIVAQLPLPPVSALTASLAKLHEGRGGEPKRRVGVLCVSSCPECAVLLPLTLFCSLGATLCCVNGVTNTSVMPRAICVTDGGRTLHRPRVCLVFLARRLKNSVIPQRSQKCEYDRGWVRNDVLFLCVRSGKLRMGVPRSQHVQPSNDVGFS